MATTNGPVGDGCFVTHLECSETGEHNPSGVAAGVSATGAPLLVRYDLDAISRAVSKRALATRSADLWRYREFLPYPDASHVVSLGEQMTPLIALPRTCRRLGGGDIIVKDEGRLPSGSFKARGMALAVTMARAFGVERIAMPTAGNAGGAAAAYAARAGMECFVFTPADTPEVTIREIGLLGARVFRVDGIISDCNAVVAGGMGTMGWYDMTTLREPYRIEGKKTMGLELAEQLDWSLPDAIFYPTGGGTGLIGMWKAFKELAAIGWLECGLPRMVAVQSTGCGPIVKAFETGAREVAEPWADVRTEIHGVRVPKPLGDRLILDTLYESKGFAEAVSDADAAEVRERTATEDGVHLCPEGAACLAAYTQALEAGKIGREAKVVVFNSASGLKSPMPPVETRLDTEAPIDYAGLETGAINPVGNSQDSE